MSHDILGLLSLLSAASILSMSAVRYGRHGSSAMSLHGHGSSVRKERSRKRKNPFRGIACQGPVTSHYE